ncbi:FAD-dependent oxidoreductase [Pajaroellobacter abortibovis]|uniref:FAD-dependent oxidoreductase n=1 Tax=Pajaroellobacter abortibovis TaxID=1882918 RepID=UPI001FE99CEE|nr:FAD-dependent oxidoreductase [Pajaroellobacter abortibovis]
MGIEGYQYADLFLPERLEALYHEFNRRLSAQAPDLCEQLEAYRRGVSLEPPVLSQLLIETGRYVSAFIACLFQIESEVDALRTCIIADNPIWQFSQAFVKKRLLKPQAGQAWSTRGGHLGEAAQIARLALAVVSAKEGTAIMQDEETAVARAVLALLKIEGVARKVAKAGGAEWTPELLAAMKALFHALRREGDAFPWFQELLAVNNSEEKAAEWLTAVVDAVECWLAHRLSDPLDPIAQWPSLMALRPVHMERLVKIHRSKPSYPWFFVGPPAKRRYREGFQLNDVPMTQRQIGRELDYCLLCHTREKDSCSKGLVDPKTKKTKKNPLGVSLGGCPLDEKISEMQLLYKQGDPLAALVLICLDNPLCPGTGHRICNDCMKSCIFQKQEPVNIPQVETYVLKEVLQLPWGFEIYGLLTRWNPLHRTRPYLRPYRGKKILVIGLGPAGYTLAYHLASEGFGVVAVDGVKLEPLPSSWVGTPEIPPTPIRDISSLYEALEDRVLRGFGGVSEYGITNRWDKNFLLVLYLTLARQKYLRMYGGIRFGGTLTLEDAWAYGFDHVALAVGAGGPTFVGMKNDLARGIRAASDFLMTLQLTGAYKKNSLANLQVSLPALVIGGGLTAIDTATELGAYYITQIEKEAKRYQELVRAHGTSAVRAMFQDEEWRTLEHHLAHARELAEERNQASVEGRDPCIHALIERWGGVTLVYRRTLQESPAYRLSHEEVTKGLEEGIQYAENLTPREALLDEQGHVRGVRFTDPENRVIDLEARSVWIAAGTSPNISYEKEHQGNFQLDSRSRYFQPHRADLERDGRVNLIPVFGEEAEEGFFTNYSQDGRTVSFYGDAHPVYAGSVVKAMASAKRGYSHLAALFPSEQTLAPGVQRERDTALFQFFSKLDEEWIAKVVDVRRLSDSIIEITIKAPAAARRFQPGQFYRLQNYESCAPWIQDTQLIMEGLALTGAWTDPSQGLIGTIVLEIGGSSRLCATLMPGERVLLMGPTGCPTEVGIRETVLLCGGGLGNAVLFSIARAFKEAGGRVLYFAGYKKGEAVFKQDEIERSTDQVIWATEGGVEIRPRRPQDHHFRGNLVEAMLAYAKGEGLSATIPIAEVHRMIAIGSDRMMQAIQQARHGVLAPFLDPKHRAIGSINSPMQCMMKEICAQCVQKHRDPHTGKELFVFSCFNQDQELDRVDFAHLEQRLLLNSMQEKLSNAWLDLLLCRKERDILRV